MVRIPLKKSMVYRLPPHLKVNNVSNFFFFFLAKLTRGSLIKALMYKGGARILTFGREGTVSRPV